MKGAAILLADANLIVKEKMAKIIENIKMEFVYGKDFMAELA